MKRSESTKVKNPLSGRWIQKGGSLYQSLLQQNILFPPETLPHPSKKRITKTDTKIDNKMAEIAKKPVSYRTPTSTPTPTPSPELPVDKKNVSWAKKKPHLITERRSLLENCGKRCFLLPEQMKFPICNKTLPCEYNCRGLKAASARAGQWKYKDVLKKSKRLSEALGCYINR